MTASYAIKRAVETYYHRRPHMEKLIHRAMEQHFSWDDSAKEYVKLYRRALKLAKPHAHAALIQDSARDCRKF
jgi:glycogen synthase